MQLIPNKITQITFHDNDEAFLFVDGVHTKTYTRPQTGYVHSWAVLMVKNNRWECDDFRTLKREQLGTCRKVQE